MRSKQLQLYRIIEMPDNKSMKNRMDMRPVNKTGWYTPKENRFWAGRCCYILGKVGPLVRVQICHAMFIFWDDYLIFDMPEQYLEPCNLFYLLTMRLIKEEERAAFFNGEPFKRIKKLFKDRIDT